MYRLVFTQEAQERLVTLARRNPQLAEDISTKIRWLVDNTEVIRHEKMKGYDLYSLHSGQYRILYRRLPKL